MVPDYLHRLWRLSQFARRAAHSNDEKELVTEAMKDKAKEAAYSPRFDAIPRPARGGSADALSEDDVRDYGLSPRPGAGMGRGPRETEARTAGMRSRLRRAQVTPDGCGRMGKLNPDGCPRLRETNPLITRAGSSLRTAETFGGLVRFGRRTGTMPDRDDLAAQQLRQNRSLRRAKVDRDANVLRPGISRLTRIPPSDYDCVFHLG